MGKKVAAVWYVESIGEYSNEVVSNYLVKCGGCEEEILTVKQMSLAGVTFLPIRPVTDKQLEVLKASRKTNPHLHFSLWRRVRGNGTIKLFKSDASYTHHRPSRKLLGSLTDGEGNPVDFPLKRKRPRQLS